MAIFENAHSGTTPAPLRQNGVAGVEIALTPLRHSGAGGDSGITPASLRQSAVEVDSGRRRFGGQKSANQLDKLRLELYDLVGVLDEWAPQQRRLAGYELNNGEEVAAYSVETQKELGLIGNGPDETLGNFDMDRANNVLQQMKDAGLDVPAELKAEDIYTNEFVDPSIGL